MKRFWNSRGARKFRRSKMALFSAGVIAIYLLIALLVTVGVISKEVVEGRVGPGTMPGFGIRQTPEKRWDDAESKVNTVARALGRSSPKDALAEVRFGAVTIADRPLEDLRADITEANRIMDRLAESDDVNEDKALWPEIDRLEKLVASLFTEPGFVQKLLLLCGTDRQGRSISARGLYAIKVAVQIGIVVGIIAVVIGALLGSAAAFFGSWVDQMVIWLYSALSAIPYLVLLGVLIFMFAGSKYENSLIPIYVAFSLTFWIGPCRVIRGETLRVRELDYIQAANALGQRRGIILLRHIIPNVSHLIFINFSLLFIAFFWQIGTATFLMFGLVLAFNIFTDALQDALDPKHIG